MRFILALVLFVLASMASEIPSDERIVPVLLQSISKMQVGKGSVTPTVIYVETKSQDIHEEIESLSSIIKKSVVVERGKSAILVEASDYDKTRILIVKAGRFVLVSWWGQFTYIYWPRAKNVIGHAVFVHKADLVMVLWSQVEEDEKGRYEGLWESIIDRIYPRRGEEPEQPTTPDGAITDRREVPA